MIKIVFIINNLCIGGIQKAFVNLMKELANNYDITLVVFSNHGGLKKALPVNIKLITLNDKLEVLGLSQKEVMKKGIRSIIIRTLGAVFSRVFSNRIPINLLINKLKLSGNYDYGISYMQFAPAKLFTGGTNEFLINCVNATNKITFVHSDFKNYGGNTFYTQKMYRKFDRIAVCSNSSREQFLKVLPELSCKTFVVKNCNDYDEIKKMSDEAMIKYNKEFINVLTVSRLSIEKGVERGIKAIAKCIRKGIKVKYHIVGDGPEKKRLEQIAAKYGVEKEINFYGNQINPYSFMKAADLLLFPSIHEAAGLVVEEARVLKLPILATKTISSQEMILDKNEDKFMKPKISIIIATLNSGKTLKQTLDSIRHQTYKNIELIIIDGLSSDNTLDLIKEYSDVVTKCISERDNGIYEAFNKGITLATGDYIGFIGSDDCYLNYNVFESIINDFIDDIDMISYPIVCIDEYYKNEYIFFNTLDKEDILTGKMLPHPGLFVKTKIMKKYMFNDKNKIISDYEFLLRYLIDGGVVKFRDYPVAYFSNSGVSSGNFNSESWKCEISEHLTLYKSLKLEQKYLFGYLNQVFKYEERENTKYLIILLMKNLLKKFKLAEIVKILLGIKKKHKCNLKYCRWCGRYGE